MRLAQTRLGLDPPTVRTTPRPRGALDLLQLQRTAGNRATSALIARLPYQTTYSESAVRRILNQSEGRVSPVTAAEGHPRQHVGRLGKAEEHAEEEGKTKSVFTSTEQQDKAVKDVLTSPAGQAQLALLDVAPAVASRQVINSVETQSTDVLVVKARKKKRRAGAPAPVAVPGPALPGRRRQRVGVPGRDRDQGVGDRRVDRQRPTGRHPHPDRLSRRLAAALF
jgi:hypothetical protein